MAKVYYRGVVTKKHASGMVESDKGFKFPYSKANIGDIMIDADASRQIVTKEEYTKTWEKQVKSTAKAEEEAAAAKALVKTTISTSSTEQTTQATQALIDATQALKEATAVASNTMAASLATNETNEEGNNGSAQQ